MSVITGSVASLAGIGSSNPYGKSSQGEWNLARGIYTRSDGRAMVFFFETAADEPRHQKTSMEQVQDSGGRRLAVYEYPYRDGQKVRDLGRKGETFNFQIKFFGLDYQRKFKEFLDVVYYSNLGGTIVHPVRGAMQVRFRDFEHIHRFDEWNAVTIRATFIEDTPEQTTQSTFVPLSVDASLRDGMQTLSDVQSLLTKAIGDADLVNVARNTLKSRLAAVVAQVGQLMGNLVATFSTDAKLKSLASQGSQVTGGLTNLSNGKTTSGTGTEASLPPVFQTGFDATTQANVNAQVAFFVQASQITTQQAVFQANQARQGISAAINEAEGIMGVEAFDIVVTYRGLAVAIQSAVEASISTSQSLVRLFVTPRAMSLRKVAELNGLAVDRQNDLESLNPYLPSVNFVPAGTQITVPAV